jgi:hypothetical protein
MDPTDLKRLAAEVSVQHGIRVDPDDPMMVVVTLNRLVLEDTLNEALHSIHSEIAEFNQAVERVQVRSGSVIAQEVRGCVAALRQELQKDIEDARLDARELIKEMQQSQSQTPFRQKMAVHVLGGTLLFVVGFSLGMLLR